MLADRVFEPLYGTHELHSSKEGFTFHRPTAKGVAPNGAEHPLVGQERPRVCGKVANTNGEHFDQRALDTGLHCIQSSTALLDQDDGDGCFLCWPGTHREHPKITKDIWRGESLSFFSAHFFFFFSFHPSRSNVTYTFISHLRTMSRARVWGSLKTITFRSYRLGASDRRRACRPDI